MELYTLASSSKGNCALVSQADSRLLVDAGISLRRITKGLGTLGLTPQTLDGILSTHAHRDHVAGLPMLAKHCPLPLFSRDSGQKGFFLLVAGLGAQLGVLQRMVEKEAGRIFPMGYAF